jgi:hypothetical protein
MLDDHLDVLAPDELEQLQTCRVEEVIARHGIEEYFQDRLEKFVLDDLSIMRLVVEAKYGAEVFERG